MISISKNQLNKHCIFERKGAWHNLLCFEEICIVKNALSVEPAHFMCSRIDKEMNGVCIV